MAKRKKAPRKGRKNPSSGGGVKQPRFAFTTKYRNFPAELKVPVEIGAYQPSHSMITTPTPGADLGMQGFKAIIDTGATASVLSQKVVDALGLISIGQRKVHTANGIATQPVFLVTIGLPNGIMVPGLQVTCANKLAGTEVLIGMDIINYGDMALSQDGAGNRVLSFQEPSMTNIDFVADIRKENEGKPFFYG